MNNLHVHAHQAQLFQDAPNLHCESMFSNKLGLVEELKRKHELEQILCLVWIKLLRKLEYQKYLLAYVLKFDTPDDGI